MGMVKLATYLDAKVEWSPRSFQTRNKSTVKSAVRLGTKSTVKSAVFLGAK
jgi:hypothetical protein